MNILIYNPSAERAGGFIIDVGQEQAQIDIAVSLPDAVQCMQKAYYELLLAENITVDEVNIAPKLNTRLFRLLRHIQNTSQARQSHERISLA